MHYISWNVNGLRAALRNGFLDFLEEHRPDAVCLQEVKAMPEQIDVDLPGEYHPCWNSAEKKGYSGTLTLTRHKPLTVANGIGNPEGDAEGRVQTLEFEDHYLVNCYTPNARRELVRLDFRQQWDADFLDHIRMLDEKKPVVFCGDYNVAHQEIDLANPRSNRRNPGFTDEEREGFTRILEAGFLDTFREFEQGGGHYTWWTYRGGARARNVGWRIDYFGVSARLRPALKGATILSGVHGSDHCPVGIKLEV